MAIHTTIDARNWQRVCRGLKRSYGVLGILLMLVLTVQAGLLAAQREQVALLGNLTNVPVVCPAEGFAVDGGIKPVFFEALPWKGKPTRVFAWLGLPENQAGKFAGHCAGAWRRRHGVQGVGEEVERPGLRRDRDGARGPDR